jgi:type I restriction enzyme, S subunit
MNYPLVPLGNIIKQRSEFIEIDDFKTYKRCRVQLHAQGIVQRDIVQGIEIKTKKQQVCRAGEFLVAEIDAKVGGFGIVPKNLDGAIVSSHYFLFDLDETLLNQRLLEFFVRTPTFMEQVKAQGTTNYAAIRPADVLKYKVPLPSLEEQHQIVARIEELTTKIEEARGLRGEAVGEVEILLTLTLNNLRKKLLSSSYPKDRIGHITQVSSGGTPSRGILSYWGGNIPWIKTGELLDRDISQAEESITEEGLANSGAKLFPPNTVLVALYGQGQTRGRTGRLMIEAATNQACCAILPTPACLEPRFTQYWLRSLYLEMREIVRDGAQPNWNGQMIKNIEIALPPLSEQKRIIVYLDDLQSKIDPLKQLQSETTAELNALLPSILDKAFKGEL